MNDEIEKSIMRGIDGEELLSMGGVEEDSIGVNTILSQTFLNIVNCTYLIESTSKKNHLINV